ncbi:alpha/beta fold hydrolase [Microbacterium jepli]|uniref:alpha/beta fold hydrolase n=1 Tax=Microbacterium sp. 1P10UE TaxID=3132288 RepID=UPI0039A25BD7
MLDLVNADRRTPHMTGIERRTAQSVDGPVSYLAAGSGPVLVLVHGTGGSAESNWGHLIPELAQTHRVIAPDLPGSGETAIGTTPLELDRLGRAIVAAVAAEGVDNLRIVGFSLGSVVAVQAALLLPGRIESALLIGGWVSPSPRLRVQMELWRRLLASDPPAAAASLTLSGFSSTFLNTLELADLRASLDEMARTFPAGMAAQAELNTRVEIESLAGTLEFPVTVVGMREDQMVPIDGVRGA